MSSLVLLLSAHLLSNPAIEPTMFLGANPLGPKVIADTPDAGHKKKKKKKEEGEED